MCTGLDQFKSDWKKTSNMTAATRSSNQVSCELHHANHLLTLLARLSTSVEPCVAVASCWLYPSQATVQLPCPHKATRAAGLSSDCNSNEPTELAHVSGRIFPSPQSSPAVWSRKSVNQLLQSTSFQRFGISSVGTAAWVNLDED